MSITSRLAALRLQRYLITGALTLLPLWLTWIVFSFVLGLLSGFSTPWIAALAKPLAQAWPFAFGWLLAPWVQSAIAVFVTILLIYLVGWATNRVVGQRLIGAFDRAVARIPMVQTIYGGSKKLLELMQTKPDGTHRVVLIEFPNSQMKTVGLVTRTMRDADTGHEYAAVYVPTTPNPTSGYLEIVPLERITPTDWTMDQAMAFIISGGAIAPADFRFGATRPLPPVPTPGDPGK